MKLIGKQITGQFRKDKMNLKVEFACLTKPQLLALFQFFKNWEILCCQGSSRKMSFYVDGDGNFHPKIGIELPTEINGDDLRLAQQLYENKTEIDFDNIAWKLREKE